MPELPEVETIKNDIRQAIVGLKIIKAKVINAKSIRSTAKCFADDLPGNRISSVDRIGKLIFIALAPKEKYWLVHLGMTGQIIYVRGSQVIAGGHSGEGGRQRLDLELPGKHTRAWVEFEDGSRLYFNDQRLFGYMSLAMKFELEKRLSKYGADPIAKSFTSEKLSAIIRNRKTNIKAVLLNQDLIAGIGNIYADEALYAAGIFPGRIASDLKPEEIKRLAGSIRQILLRAIKFRGTTFSDYRDASGRQGNFTSQLKVYGKSGQKCLRCGNYIKKIKLAGRGTSYCEACQK